MSSPTLELIDEVVRAGAGAGKTTNLTRKVIDLCLQFKQEQDRWPQLVVTTFTRKATQELRERLIVDACERRDPLLLDYVSSRSRLHISTIHGVFSLFLKRYGHLMDLDTGYSVVGNQEAQMMVKKTLRDIIVNEAKFKAFLEVFDFNRLCQMAWFYYQAKLEGPEATPPNEEIFSRLFLQKKQEWAEELENIRHVILSEAQVPSWITYAENLAGVVAELRNESLESSGEQVIAVIKELGRKPSFSKKKPPVSEAAAEQLKQCIDGIKKDLSDPSCQPAHWPRFMEVYNDFQELGEVFVRNFLEVKKKSGKFEMGDLELLTYESIRKEPQLAESFSEDWDYWLIDEFQDTSPMQVNILRSLIGERTSYVVGDPQQSIYLFRGARSEVFDEREQEVKTRGGELLQLQKNYRSQPELLLFFNDFFKALSPDFQSMEPRSRESIDETKVVAHFVLADECEEEGCSKVHNENLALLNHICDLLSSGCQPEDICVLSRTNRTLKEIAQFLDEHHIPTHVHAASGFYDRREILDALALLKFLVNPHDNNNLVMLLRSPWCRVPDDGLVKLIAEAKSLRLRSYWQHLATVTAEGDLENLGSLQQALTRGSQLGVTASFEKSLVELGFFDLAHKHDSTGRRESNLWKLLHSLKQEEMAPGFNFLNFISNSFVDLSDSDGAEESDAVAALEPNCVNLMTVHASKGLQFKHVLLPRSGKGLRLSRQSAQSGLFNYDQEEKLWSFAIPLGDEGKMVTSLVDRHYLAKLEKREMAEADRVLYVALTRAVESVFISWTEPFQSRSWVERMRWDLSDGLHAKDSYSYKVDRGPWESRSWNRESSKALRVRSAYLSEPRANHGEFNLDHKYSVSSVLEEANPGSSVVSSTSSPIELKEQLSRSSEGVLVHRMMEILKYSPEFDFAKYAETWFGEKAEMVLGAIDYVRKIDQLPLASIIENGFVEWGFQQPTEKGIMEGQIDLWGTVLENGKKITWVVDYKSGSSKYKEKAFKQLSLYAKALQGYGVEGELRLAVVYPLSQDFEVRKL